MWRVFRRSLRDRRVAWLIYTLSGVALLLLYVSIFPSLQAQIHSYDQLIKTVPEALRKSFGIEASSLTTIEGYLSTEQFSLVWPIITIIFALSFAGRALAGEIENRTLSLLLSRPLSRLQLFWSKYLAGLFLLLLMTTITVLASIPLSALFNLDYHVAHFVTMWELGLLFTAAIYSLAILASSVFSEKGKVYGTIGGVLVLMYVLNIVSTLLTSLDKLKYTSFFYYYSPSGALIHGQLAASAIIVFSGATVIATLLAAWWFNRRDITI